MFVKSELKARLAQKEMNVEALASGIGMDKATLYRKIGSGNFSLNEVDQISDALEFSEEDVLSVFFGSEVSNNETEKEVIT